MPGGARVYERVLQHGPMLPGPRPAYRRRSSLPDHYGARYALGRGLQQPRYGPTPGTSLDTLGRLPEAIKAYAMAMRLLSGDSQTEHSVMGNLFQSLQPESDLEQLETLLQDPRAQVQPFHGLSYPFSAELALRIARHHAALQSPMHDRGFYRRAATELGSSGVPGRVGA
eukprot:2298501-Rhodomonas_salina.1